MTNERISDTGFLTITCGFSCLLIGAAIGLTHGSAWNSFLFGISGLILGGVFGAFLGNLIILIQKYVYRNEIKAHIEKEINAKKETEKRAQKEILEKGSSWEIPILCAYCGKAQPSGRVYCSECNKELKNSI